MGANFRDMVYSDFVVGAQRMRFGTDFFAIVKFWEIAYDILCN